MVTAAMSKLFLYLVKKYTSYQALLLYCYLLHFNIKKWLNSSPNKKQERPAIDHRLAWRLCIHYGAANWRIRK